MTVGWVSKVCQICGLPFVVKPSRAKSAKTCSLKCRGQLIGKRYEEGRAKLICEGCGAKFSAPQCHAGRRVYCSMKCAEPSRKINRITGKDHYAWRGGIAHHTGGYIYLLTPEHPFGGRWHYVFEHRLVVEKEMRLETPDHPFLVAIRGEKYLRPGILVHHINEDKIDNHYENLLACTAGAHLAIHDGRAPMVGEVWPEIEGLAPFEPYHIIQNCRTCGNEFSVKRSDFKRGHGKYCCRKCADNRDRTSSKIQKLRVV